MSTTTKRIADYVQKPSQAIRFMIAGLKRQSQRNDFLIHMGRFLSTTVSPVTGKLVCCGCAATCAVQEIAGVNITLSSTFDERYRFTASTCWERIACIVGFAADDVREFEDAMDWVRLGEVESLFHWCGIREMPSKYCHRACVLPELREDWFEQLDEYEAFAAELEREGF